MNTPMAINFWAGPLRYSVKIFFTLVLFLVQSNSHGQTIVSGLVGDAVDKTGLPGAHILVEGSFAGTYTDLNGRFRIAIDETPPVTLRFTMIGFEDLLMEISSSIENLEVELQPLAYETNQTTVIARLREEIVQEIPMSVSVVEQTFLQRSNEMDDLADLIPYIPGFSGKNPGPSTSFYTIRGINTNSFGVGAESSVAVFFDGAYNGRVNFGSRGFFDIQRIEVLKGPQSTLFGRNSSAGVISIYSHSPKFYRDFSVETKFGNWGQQAVTYQFNYPFSDKLAVRLSGQWEERDGVRRETNLGFESGKKDVLGNRFSLLWKPTHNFNMTLKLEQYDASGNGWGSKSTNTDLGSDADLFTRTHQKDFRDFDMVNHYTGSLVLNWILNDRLVLNSISSLHYGDREALFDLDASPTYFWIFGTPTESTNGLQEFRLRGKTDRVDWVIASSLFVESVDQEIATFFNDGLIVPVLLNSAGVPLDFCIDNPACLFMAEERSFNKADNTSFGIYGNADISLTDKLGLSLGFRFANDHKKYLTHMALGSGAFHALSGMNLLGPIGRFEGQKTWNSIQPSVALDYHFSDRLMVYGSYGRGYNAGGFNNFTAAQFEAETNDAFEVGFKSTLCGDRLRLNFTAYYMDYQNLQVQTIKNTIVEVDNAAQLTSKGIEIESSYRPVNNLNISMTLGLNDAEYGEYIIPDQDNPGQLLDFSGNKTNRNPETQFSIYGDYTLPLIGFGELLLRADYSYQSKIFFNRTNVDELSGKSHGLLNAQIGLGDLFGGKVDLLLFGSNLTDANYLVHADPIPITGPIYVPGWPRLWGVKLRANNLFNWFD
jgi:iron complex outermembrane receptor protein